jgi:uncharacterized membrane protein
VPDPSPVEKPRMPTSVRVAVLLLLLLGVLVLATSALIVLQQDEYVDGLVRQGQSRDSAGQVALLLMIAYAILGVTGLLVMSLLTVISLLLQLFNGVVTTQALVILAAAVVGTVCLSSRQTKEWVHGPVRMD